MLLGNPFLTLHLMPTPIYMLLCFVFILHFCKIVKYVQTERTDFFSDPFANSGSLGPDHLESTILKLHINKQNLSSIHLELVILENSQSGP